MTVSKGGQAFGIERDGDIHLAALDPLVDAVGAVLNHLDLNIGILHGEIGDQVAEKAGAEQRREAQGEFAGAVFVGGLHIVQRLLIQVQDLLGLGPQAQTLVGQVLLPVEGVKELNTQLLLQFFDRDGQRGLRHRQTLCCLGVAARLCHRRKIIQLFDIHRNAFLPCAGIGAHFVSS